MSFEEIKALFPITTTVTQEIIDNSDVNKIHSCIGANTVKALTQQYEGNIHWGRINGYIHSVEKDNDYIQLQSTCDMMKITEPTEVTFTIVNQLK